MQDLNKIIETKNLQWELQVPAWKVRNIIKEVAVEMLPAIKFEVSKSFELQGYEYINNWASVSKNISNSIELVSDEFAEKLTKMLAKIEKLEKNDPDYKEGCEGILNSGIPKSLIKSDELKGIIQEWVYIDALALYPESIYTQLEAVETTSIKHKATEVVQLYEGVFGLHHKRSFSVEAKYKSEVIHLELHTDAKNKFCIVDESIKGTSLEGLSESLNMRFRPHPTFPERFQDVDRNINYLTDPDLSDLKTSDLGMEAKLGVNPEVVAESVSVSDFRVCSYYEQIKREVEAYKLIAKLAVKPINN